MQLMWNRCASAGDARNDIFVTLEGGSFSKGTKTAERNVEVAVSVVDKSGTVIPVSPSSSSCSLSPPLEPWFSLLQKFLFNFLSGP